MTKSLALATVATTFIATAVALATPAHAGDGNDLLKFAPENSQMVLVFDMADARDSALLQKGFQKLIDTSAEAKAKLAELGLDPMKDLDTVMFAGGGATDLTGDDAVKNVMIVIEGRLPKDKLASIPNAKASTYAGITIYTNADTDAAFIGDRLFFTKKGAMKATVDVVLNKGKGKGKSVATSRKAKAMRDAIALTDTTADLWATVLVPAKNQKDMKAEQGMIAKTVTAGFNFTADLAASLQIVTDSEASAGKALAMIQGQLPQVNAGLGQVGLTKAAKSITAVQTGAALKIGVTLTEAELMSLLQLAKQFAGAGAGGTAP